jgi:hypothetical protein
MICRKILQLSERWLGIRREILHSRTIPNIGLILAHWKGTFFVIWHASCMTRSARHEGKDDVHPIHNGSLLAARARTAIQCVRHLGGGVHGGGLFAAANQPGRAS